MLVGTFLLTSIKAIAQRDSSYTWYTRANYHRGILLPEYSYFDYVTNNYTNGIELGFARKTKGKTFWDQIYGYPSWGVNLYAGSCGNRTVFGNQFNISPYFNAQILRLGRVSLNTQMGLGITYVSKRYEPFSNPTNIAIGSHTNIYFMIQSVFQYQLTQRDMLDFGLSFSHFSNANLSEPNVGLNFSTLTFGLWHALGKKEKVVHHDIEKFKPNSSFSAMLTGGMKHTRTFESFQYGTAAISFDVKRRFGYCFALGLGSDLFYDSSIGDQMRRLKQVYRPQYAFTSGIHLSQEFIFAQFSVILQEGFYLGLPDQYTKHTIYNRLITRYTFANHLFVNLSLKSHLVVLDFPELGIGINW
jgi:hypothetical protein